VSGLRDGELETAGEMSRALSGGEVSSVELVERALERAEAWQPATNAFSQLWPDEAVEAARAADAARAAGNAPGPFAGVPIAVKDLYDVAGRETTGCCDAYRGRVAHRDGPVIAATRAAGLVMVGKTNQHELAHGATNLVSACGQTRNPWDPARMTGGSSGGSAAAAAAGVVPWSLGSDTGGSIRIPASMCGTFGLKPTTGLLSIEGMLPLAPSLDCPGPLAGTPADLWALFRIMGGLPDAPPTREISGPKVGVPGGPFHMVAASVGQAVEGMAEHLASVGCSVEDLPGPELDDDPPGGLRGIWHVITDEEFVAAHEVLRDRLDQVAPSVAAHFDHAGATSPEQVAGARNRRAKVRRWFLRQLERVDVLLLPTTPYPAPSADQRTVDLGTHGVVDVDRVGPGWLTSIVNLAGLPAVNIPVDRTLDGLPVGVTIVGGDGAEAMLSAVVQQWSRTLGAALARPPRPV
jgi:aspartyl-tRNA(Asn)/glutamyl-tRNA(Gln) amidotransferase subunit A